MRGRNFITVVTMRKPGQRVHNPDRRNTGDSVNLNQTIQTAGGPRDVAGISSHSGTSNGSEQAKISTNSRETSIVLKAAKTRG